MIFITSRGSHDTKHRNPILREIILRLHINDKISLLIKTIYIAIDHTILNEKVTLKKLIILIFNK